MNPMPEGLQLDFLRASSYVGASTKGEEAVTMGLVSKIPVQNRHIILVEDIIDTGKTLQV
jgi:hypoxanthine phosphoribosyltransferase